MYEIDKPVCYEIPKSRFNAVVEWNACKCALQYLILSILCMMCVVDS